MKEICYRIKDFLVEFFSRLLEWDKKELFLLLIENLKNLNLFLSSFPSSLSHNMFECLKTQIH